MGTRRTRCRIEGETNDRPGTRSIALAPLAGPGRWASRSIANRMAEATSIAGKSRTQRRSRKSTMPAQRSIVMKITKPEIRKKISTPIQPLRMIGSAP